MLRGFIAGCLVAVAICTAPKAHAQVLIWKLPENPTAWARFEGSYNIDDKSTASEIKLEYAYELTVKSLGQETAEFDGSQVPCRWIEFKSTTKPRGGQPGPAAIRIYKVLIPESRVTGKLKDELGLPIDFLPVVRGYRKIGERDVVEIKEKSLNVSPLIVPVVFYPNLKAEGDAGPLDIPAGQVTAQIFTGEAVSLSPTLRSTNKARLWLAPETPFGIASLELNIVREEKDNVAAADTFTTMATTDVKLQLVEQGTDAVSDLPDSK